jgi:ferritin-like metal-binding protein YciE
MATNDGLRALLIHEIRDLYDADKQLLTAWPKLAKAASAESLVTLCREGVEYTEERIRRLDRVFELLGEPARAKPSHAMKGLIRQALDTIGEGLPEAAMDAAILAAVQKISTYGMAGYGVVHGYAQALREREIADLLDESLEEKKDAVVEEEGMAKHEFIPRVLKTEGDIDGDKFRGTARQSSARRSERSVSRGAGMRQTGRKTGRGKSGKERSHRAR